MEAVAQAKYQRISWRKVAEVLALIRGKSVPQAYRILEFVPKAAKPIIEKTLHSAVANLGKSVNPENLFLKICFATPGPALKRFRAGPMGRAMPYKRKTCHLTITVTDKK